MRRECLSTVYPGTLGGMLCSPSCVQRGAKNRPLARVREAGETDCRGSGERVRAEEGGQSVELRFPTRVFRLEALDEAGLV